MEKIISTFILILLISIACTNDKKIKYPVFEISSVECNYFENDSMQQIAGNYPLKLYLHSKIVNTNDFTIFFPLKNNKDSFLKSDFQIIYNNQKLINYKIIYSDYKYIINPMGEIYMTLVIKPDINQKEQLLFATENMEEFINNIKIQYLCNREDIKFNSHNFYFFDSLNMKKTKNIEIIYRSPETIDEEVDWI